MMGKKILYKIYCGIIDKIKPICFTVGYFSSPDEANEAAKQEAIKFYKAKAHITPGLKDSEDIVQEYFNTVGFSQDSDEEIKKRYDEYILNNVEYYVCPWRSYKIYIGIANTIAAQCVYIGDFTDSAEAETVAKQKAIDLYKAVSSILPSVADEEMSQAIIYYIEPWVLNMKLEMHEVSDRKPYIFTVNDVEASIEDFGLQYDRVKCKVSQSCGYMKFTKKPVTEKVLIKYGISSQDYNDICIVLENKLTIGACSQCGQQI